ncbi:MAG: T9SS type A sorting domain-containing protein [Chitinophagales bacterium]|nr:T9SS type A sorting domain-containing protein [Chitinophagales bacterium]
MKSRFLLLFTAIWIYNLNAQNISPVVVSSAGESYQGNLMQIDWTLGELAITSIQNSSRQITQGFHQPNYIITNIKGLPENIGYIHIYPNPTSDELQIKLDLEQQSNIEVQLISINGISLWTKKIIDNQIEENINIGDLPSTTYFLRFVIDESNNYQIFKIQKIN